MRIWKRVSIWTIIVASAFVPVFGCRAPASDGAASLEQHVDDAQERYGVVNVTVDGVQVFLTIDYGMWTWEAAVGRSGTVENVYGHYYVYAKRADVDAWDEHEIFVSESYDFNDAEWTAVSTALNIAWGGPPPTWMSVGTSPSMDSPLVPAEPAPPPAPAATPWMTGNVRALDFGPATRPLPATVPGQGQALPAQGANTAPAQGQPKPGAGGGGFAQAFTYLYAFYAGWQAGNQLGAGTPPRPVPAVTAPRPGVPATTSSVGTGQVLSQAQLNAMANAGRVPNLNRPRPQPAPAPDAATTSPDAATAADATTDTLPEGNCDVWAKKALPTHTFTTDLTVGGNPRGTHNVVSCTTGTGGGLRHKVVSGGPRAGAEQHRPCAASHEHGFATFTHGGKRYTSCKAVKCLNDLSDVSVGACNNAGANRDLYDDPKSDADQIAGTFGY